MFKIFWNTAAGHGRRDGKMNKPTTETLLEVDVNGAILKVAGFEATVIKQSEQRIANMRKEYEPKKQKFKEILHTLDLQISKALNTKQEHEAKLNGKHPKSILTPRMYWVIMFILSILEYPFNKSVFELFLLNGESGIEQYTIAGVALLVSFSMILMAHFLGLILKQFSHVDKLSTVKIGIIAGIMILAISFSFVALQELRGNYNSLAQQSNIDVTSELVSDENIVNKNQTEIDNSSQYMIVFNILFFVVGMALSYFNHDQDRELEENHSLAHKYDAIAERLIQRRAKLAASYDLFLNKLKMLIKYEQEKCLALISEYRDYCLKYRTDNVVPAWSVISDSFFSVVDLGDEAQLAVTKEMPSLFRDGVYR